MLASGSIQNLNSVFFTNSNCGYTACGNGTILKTTDGAASWTSITTGTSNWLDCIYFVNDRIGYAVGEGATILKTTNSGMNWTLLSSPVSKDFLSVYFTDSLTGYIVGGDIYQSSLIGTVLKTINGGTSWTVQVSGYTTCLNSVLFYDANHGYSTGMGGTILKTMNGGTNWSPVVSISGKNLYSVYAKDDNTVYVNGADGIILKNSKTLFLSSVFLEALYNGSGTMRKAQDASGNHFPGTVADRITIELHDPNQYNTIIYTDSNVEVNVDGTACASIPSIYSGSYYITVRHRNSIETVSAIPISFSGIGASYSFESPSKAYGSNLLQSPDSHWLIYGGDVNQDGIVDSGDMIPVDNLSTNFASGYIPEDTNGDGIIDSGDMIVVDNNVIRFVSRVTP